MHVVYCLYCVFDCSSNSDEYDIAFQSQYHNYRLGRSSLETNKTTSSILVVHSIELEISIAF